MPTNFPTSVDVLTNPAGGNTLNSPSHASQHTNLNDAMEAVQSYLLNGRPAVSVVDFGAVGDGVTNDLAAFNAAVAALVASSGGTILVPDGTYLLGNSWNIDLQAVHVELSPAAIVKTTSTTTDGHTLAFIGGGPGLGTATTPQQTWASIRGGTVQNSGSGGTANAIGFVRYKNARCIGVRVPICDKKAITAQYGVDNILIEGCDIDAASETAITVENTCVNAVVRDNFVTTTGRGIFFTTTITHALCEGNVVDAGTDGIGLASITRAIIRGNTVKAGAKGITATTVAGLIIENNIVREAGQHPIFVDACTVSIRVDGNAIHLITGAANTYDAIYLEDCTIAPLVNNNYIATTTHRWAINTVNMTGFPGIYDGNLIVDPGDTGVFGGTLAKAGLNLVAGVQSHVSAAYIGPISPAHINSAGTDLAAANRAMIWPFIAPRDMSVTTARFRVQTGGSGNFDVGIYDAALVRLGSSGSVAVPASGTTQAQSIGTVRLIAGQLYYAAFVCSSTTPKFEGYVTPGAAWVTGNAFFQRQETALPLPDPFVVAATDDVPRVIAIFFS